MLQRLRIPLGFILPTVITLMFVLIIIRSYEGDHISQVIRYMDNIWADGRNGTEKAATTSESETENHTKALAPGTIQIPTSISTSAILSSSLTTFAIKSSTIVIKTSTTSPPKATKPSDVPPLMNTTFIVSVDSKRDPAGPKPSQIIILSVSDGKGTGSIDNVLERTSENRQAYADKHGYINHYVNLTKFDLHGAHPVWGKILGIVDSFQQFSDVEWIWCLDLDAIIMTSTIDLVSHLLSRDAMNKILLKNEEFHNGDGYRTQESPKWEDVDFVIAQDHMSINAGSFFVRRSKYTQVLLDMWVDPKFIGAGWPGREQQALLHILRHHPTFRDHLGLVPQYKINGFPHIGHPMGWNEGDLVVHFAGCWMGHHCNKLFNEFWQIKK